MFPILLGLIIILIAILVSGFFSASETALMAFRAHRVPKDCRAEHLNLIKSLLKYPDRLLSVILLKMFENPPPKNTTFENNEQVFDFFVNALQTCCIFGGFRTFLTSNSDSSQKIPRIVSSGPQRTPWR